MHRTPWTLGVSLFVLGATFSVGCGTIDDFEEVIVDEATLPGSRTAGTPVTGMYGGDFNDLDLSTARNFENQGVEPGDVDGIFVKSIQLEMDTGSGNPDIDRLAIYVEQMTVWVEAPGQDRAIVAILSEVPDAKTADLMVEQPFTQGDDRTGLKPYAVAESMTIGADVTLTQAGADPFLNITLETTVTLLIDVNILGL